MNTIRLFAAGVALTGAAIGLACPASAELLSGSYTATLINGGMAGLRYPNPVIATPCGPDCTRLSPFDVELHPQGDNLTGTLHKTDGGTCAFSVNPQALVMDWCGDQYQLTKN